MQVGHTDCSICYDPLIVKEDNIDTLDCYHSFHTHCINKWFLQNIIKAKEATCPLCRAIIIPIAIDTMDDAEAPLFPFRELPRNRLLRMIKSIKKIFICTSR